MAWLDCFDKEEIVARLDYFDKGEIVAAIEIIYGAIRVWQRVGFGVSKLLGKREDDEEDEGIRMEEDYKDTGHETQGPVEWQVDGWGSKIYDEVNRKDDSSNFTYRAIYMWPVTLSRYLYPICLKLYTKNTHITLWKENLWFLYGLI